MPDFIIKTHQKNAIYNQPHLFILNKGLNSGKPQKEPFTNSFVVIFQHEKDCENIYYVAYSLWKSKYWNQNLVGSVIPFLRISDFKDQFNTKSKLMMEEYDEHVKHIATLKLLELKEKQFHENINLINDMRRVVAHRYCNR